MIRVPAQVNAHQMLQTQATRLGTIGDDIYYVLDGKAWRVSHGVVFRSDDARESQTLVRLARTQ